MASRNAVILSLARRQYREYNQYPVGRLYTEYVSRKLTKWVGRMLKQFTQQLVETSN